MRLYGLSPESLWQRAQTTPAPVDAAGGQGAPARRLTEQAEIIEFTSYLANRR